MKYLKMLGLAALAAMSAMAVAAGGASATTLEVAGEKQNKSVAFEASLQAGTSMVISTTTGNFLETCTNWTMKGSTEGTFTGSVVGGKLSNMTFGGCAHSTVVDSNGALTIEHTSGTNGTVRSSGMSITLYSTMFGTMLNCTTSNTHLGTLVGSASGHAKVQFNAVVNCGFFLPSAIWQGELTLTNPTGLGVVA